MRAFAQWVARAIDRRERHPDAGEREAADELVQLLTPVAKALFTDLGSEIANLGVQVFGGHGYIREHGMEQLVRDARITQIYEGANGVQALDLVGRKLLAGSGRLLRHFFEPVDAFIAEAEGDPRLAEFVTPLAQALTQFRRTTAWIVAAGGADFAEAASGATEYLRLFGLVALAYLWARMAAAALPHVDGTEATFYRAKLATARFFFDRLLPQAAALAAAVEAGGRSVRDFAEAAF